MGGEARGGYGWAGSGRAHRVAWERLVGPIPPGHDLHHLCGVKLCVNPDHLEPRLAGKHRGRPGRLSEDQLRLFWELVDARAPLDEIADQIGVDRQFLRRGVMFSTVYEPKRPSKS
jgi:hypothetical protein